MAATTMLDVVQEILSGMDSDEVNSLNDTIEAQQIAKLVRRAYDTIMVTNDLGWTNLTFQLDSQTSTDQPTHMTIPDNIHQIEWIRYNRKQTSAALDEYMDVIKLDPDQFLRLVQSQATLEAGGTSQLVMLDSLIKIWVRNDQPPTYWTTFDDKEIIFDSFDADVDDCLQTSKTACYGQIKKTIVIDDSTPIDLPPQLMDILFKTAEGYAWSHFKDGMPPEMARAMRHAEVRSQRLRFTSKQDSRKNISNTNYGRTAAIGRSSPLTKGSDSGITGDPPFFTP